MLVRITGKINGKDFCAGMEITVTIDTLVPVYKITKIAPILKKHFVSPITIEQLRYKCKKEQWLLEITL